MTLDAESIVRQAESAGVRLQLTDRGTVKAFGKNETLQHWTPILRERRDEIQQLLKGQRHKDRQDSQRPPNPPNGGSVADFGRGCLIDRLKGSAVLFVGQGAAGELRAWIVADQEDADRLRPTIQAGDLILDRTEIRELVRIDDPEIVRELLEIKRHLPGRFAGDEQ